MDEAFSRLKKEREAEEQKEAKDNFRIGIVLHLPYLKTDMCQGEMRGFVQEARLWDERRGERYWNQRLNQRIAQALTLGCLAR